MERLDHLKQSLPAMLRKDSEVIVVDYSCPEHAGDYVAQHCPDARVVRIEGQSHYSGAKSRNAGAAIATGDMLNKLGGEGPWAERSDAPLDLQTRPALVIRAP
ncbi:MAG: glycosyltransferase family A protein [Sphingomicrobium sp.]